MKNYWSCSKFAHWLLQKYCVDKPTAETMVGWRDWKKMARSKNKYVYWFVEEFLDSLQKIVYLPYEGYHAIRYYFKKRFGMKTHIINTKLTPGEWHEVETKILHGMFETLVDFIEVEKAHLHMVFTKDARKQYNYNWFNKFLDSLGLWRSPQAGIDYLKWEMTLTENGLFGEESSHNPPTFQALAAKEQYDLYMWWKYVRPARGDPYELSGWSALCEKRRQKDDDGGIFWEDQSVEERKETAKALALCNEIEKQYDEEDTEMLIRLIKIRQHLWT